MRISGSGVNVYALTAKELARVNSEVMLFSELIDQVTLAQLEAETAWERLENEPTDLDCSGAIIEDFQTVCDTIRTLKESLVSAMQELLAEPAPDDEDEGYDDDDD